MPTTLQRFLAGSTAGLLATAPMTSWMTFAQGASPSTAEARLPPRTLTLEATDAVGLSPHLGETEKQRLTLLAHYAYGAAAGGLYSLVESNLPSPSPLVRGATFGLGVWTASYLGWLPAVGSSASAAELCGRRNAVMIAAHVVWGAALGVLSSAVLTGWRTTRAEEISDDREYLAEETAQI